MQPHDLLIFIIGLAAGAGYVHFRPFTERRKTPRKRSRAIPVGTDTARKPGRPRKAPKAPPEPGNPLPMVVKEMDAPGLY